MFTFEFIDSIDKTVGKRSLEFHSKSEKKIYSMTWEVLSDKSALLWQNAIQLQGRTNENENLHTSWFLGTTLKLFIAIVMFVCISLTFV